jgi:hypothetical protein
MAAGTTGTAFNVINMQPDPLDEYLPLLRSIAKSRPFYQRVHTALGRSPALGMWPAWNRDLWAAANPDGDWFRSVRLPLNAPYALGEIGIPICYDRQHATVAALTGTAPLAFSVDELRKVFRGGVLMDVDAWRSLERLGLAEWTGVKSAEGIDQDASEVLAPHALNGRFAGWSRDCRQSFYFERVYRLGLNAGAETLARMIDYGERDLGPAMTAFENTLGGRVVVMGYYPWSQFHSLPKTTQMKNVCEWLSRGRMPARVETFAKVAVWRHERAVVVLSLSLDPVEKLSLLLRRSGTRFLWAEILGPEKEISGTSEGDSVRVTLDSLAPWSLHLLVEKS